MKTKTKMTTERVSASASGDTPQEARADYKLIPWKDMVVSPTNPRRLINEQTIESLADSIRNQGVLEPLIVREKGEKYEIVCGERRYRAAKTAALSELPCLVRELSDEQVLDIQIHENLHREDVHPMDEAYGYQFLKEKLGCETRELALRVGKPEGYVLNRLKLNLLIKEAQKDIDESHLPLSYTLEMAKYTPDIQKLIYAEVYEKEGKYQGDRWAEVPVKGEVVPWKWLIEWINTNIHRMLSKPCSIKFKASLLGRGCEKLTDISLRTAGSFPAKRAEIYLSVKSKKVMFTIVATQRAVRRSALGRI